MPVSNHGYHQASKQFICCIRFSLSLTHNLACAPYVTFLCRLGAKRDAEMKQRAAEAATAAQATISAHVYHEIRNVVGSVLALADRATEAVDLALIEDDEIGLRELPTRVRELTDHQRLVCQHAVDTLNDMLDVS